jgi:putative MATE family efflux protein
LSSAAVNLDQPAAAPTWHERWALVREVWRIALPVILTNLLQSMVDIVDVYMVGRFGPIAIAAVGLSSALRMLVLILMLSVAAGSMSLIAQAKGGRDPRRMSDVTRQSITSGLLISLVLGVVGYVLARPLLQFVNSGGEQEAVELGTQYLRIFFFGSPFLVLSVVLSRLMQGAGDTMTPLLLTVLMNVLNVIFNYVFMFGFGPIPAYGVPGAAISTVIARFIGVAALFYVIFGGRNVIRILPGSYRPKWRMIADIFQIGTPSGVQGVFRNGSRLFVLGIITATEVGTYGAAAIAIGFQVESLVFMPGLALNVAATNLVGESLGSWQPHAARLRGNMAILVGLVVMIVLAIPIVIFAPAIIRIFDPTAHPVLLATGTTYFRINTVVLPLGAVAMVANGALRGAGDSMPGLISTMLTRGVLVVGLAYALAFWAGMGSLGVWIALAAGVVLEAIYMGIRWRGSTWLNVALHLSDLYRKHLHLLPAQLQQKYLREIRTPLLAQPGAREHVNAEGVEYVLHDRTVRIEFNAEGYRVLA